MFRSELFFEICDYNVNHFHMSPPKYNLSCFDDFINQVSKVKFKEKNCFFPFI